MMGCPYKHLHVGGNDAEFTLRVLLLLVVESSKEKEAVLDEDAVTKLEIMREIGRTELPEIEESQYIEVLEEAKDEKKGERRQNEEGMRERRVLRSVANQEEIRTQWRMRWLGTDEGVMDEIFGLCQTKYRIDDSILYTGIGA